MIILFGANGVLGKEICEQLIGKDKKLILIANNGFEKIKNDYQSTENVEFIKKCNDPDC